MIHLQQQKSNSLADCLLHLCIWLLYAGPAQRRHRTAQCSHLARGGSEEKSYHEHTRCPTEAAGASRALPKTYCCLTVNLFNIAAV